MQQRPPRQRLSSNAAASGMNLDRTQIAQPSSECERSSKRALAYSRQTRIMPTLQFLVAIHWEYFRHIFECTKHCATQLSASSAEPLPYDIWISQSKTIFNIGSTATFTTPDSNQEW
jgi:hypothetical protein